jgi:hypothetical protein
MGAVGELPAEVLVEQRDTIGHVVEHDLHDLARLLDIAMGGGGFGLRHLKLALALARLGDVAGHADHAARRCRPVRAPRSRAGAPSAMSPRVPR